MRGCAEMSNNLSHYVLVSAASVLHDGSLLSSRETARRRLEKRMWALFARTPNRDHVKVGDKVLVYATRQSKRESGAFVGVAEINEVLSDSRSVRIAARNIDSATDSVAMLLNLGKVIVFNSPIAIERVRHKLEFIPKHNKWGVVFLGGCVRVSMTDFSVVLSHSSHSD
jgi:hypothetical protein